MPNEVAKMIRYSGTKKNRRKNCLITLRRGNNIFFGISRCNLKKDTYSRKEGIDRATERATLSMRYGMPDATLYMDSSGLSGQCTVSNTKFLLRYFESFK